MTVTSIPFDPYDRPDPRYFELWKNAKSGKWHIATHGYGTTWCGTDITGRAWLTWTLLDRVSAAYMDKHMMARSMKSFMCKRCTNQWEK